MTPFKHTNSIPLPFKKNYLLSFIKIIINCLPLISKRNCPSFNMLQLLSPLNILHVSGTFLFNEMSPISMSFLYLSPCKPPMVDSLLTDLCLGLALFASDFLIGSRDLLYLVDALPPEFVPGMERQVKMGELLQQYR